jgi:XTP/dITP diphosphohydrolase
VTIYAATSNPGKLAEFTAATGASSDTAIDGSNIQILALPNLASMPVPAEDASTFIGNAELKALAYSTFAPGLLVFADDSGLEATALNGAPGVRSARFADDLAFQPRSGSHAVSKDTRNNQALLHQLRSHADRSARFVCAIALARDGQILLRAGGTVAGEILTAARGEAGFGYDPLFFIPKLKQTLAELPSEQKWRISHRGAAFRSLLTGIRAATL